MSRLKYMWDKPSTLEEIKEQGNYCLREMMDVSGHITLDPGHDVCGACKWQILGCSDPHK